MDNLQQELSECREYAQCGKKLADESFKEMKSKINEEKDKLQAAERRQNSDVRIENNPIFNRQLRETESLEKDTVNRAEENIRGDGSSIGTGRITPKKFARTLCRESLDARRAHSSVQRVLERIQSELG